MRHKIGRKTNADFYRWAYTAVTRASDKLYCINPRFTHALKWFIWVLEVQIAYSELTNAKKHAVEINIDEFCRCWRFNLSDAHITIQDHFIKIWYYFQKQYIDITGWDRLGYEIRYNFKRGDENTGFIFWVNGKNEFKVNFNIIQAD